jgi:hypothetical protein
MEINSLQRANEQLLPEAKNLPGPDWLDICYGSSFTGKKLFGYYAKHSRRNGFE